MQPHNNDHDELIRLTQDQKHLADLVDETGVCLEGLAKELTALRAEVDKKEAVRTAVQESSVARTKWTWERIGIVVALAASAGKWLEWYLKHMDK